MSDPKYSAVNNARVELNLKHVNEFHVENASSERVLE